ncbi:MAG TPA: peptidase [Cyanobacteria bacterium UBA11372]|nr:peptidase [Cyanobacteria bacterium UBA11372]
MAMRQEQFDALVQRLENFARQQPGIYKLRVGLLAVLGYAYIFFVLAVLLAVVALVVLLVIYSHRINGLIIKLGVLALVPAVVVLRSLWVSFPPPAGLPLSRQQAPRLFALVNELTAKLQAPRFHHILLTEDFNAGVRQRPRLGVFGWYQNYLIVGLPLMQALSQSQFRAVLAHELGHLSGNHNRFNGWIYRIQTTYALMFERLHQSGHEGSSVLFDSFFNWYAPFFSAYSFVLRRMNEYEADRCAAELAGEKNAAEALINVEVKARFLESSFWPDVFKKVQHQIEPPATTYSQMFTAMEASGNCENATKWLAQALAEKTNNADTHPCLSDRLTALGYSQAKQQKITLPPPVKTSAAQQLLGEVLNQLTAGFDADWKQANATPWRQRYAYVQESLQKLQSLAEKAQKQPLTPEEAWNRACWTEEFNGQEVALPLFKEILETQPSHAAANYAVGQILLQKDDETGIVFIEKAMESQPDYAIDGCYLIYYYLNRHEKTKEAKAYQKRAEEYYEMVLLARQERSFVRASDEFQPHKLSASDVKKMRQQLSNYPEVKIGYLVQKVVKYFPEKPFYVMGIERRKGFLELDSDRNDNSLIDRLANEVQFPGNGYIIILNNNTNNIAKKLRKVEQSAIYPG